MSTTVSRLPLGPTTPVERRNENRSWDKIDGSCIRYDPKYPMDNYHSVPPVLPPVPPPPPSASRNLPIKPFPQNFVPRKTVVKRGVNVVVSGDGGVQDTATLPTASITTGVITGTTITTSHEENDNNNNNNKSDPVLKKKAGERRPVNHDYTDYANVPDEIVVERVAERTNTGGVETFFPEKLHELLSSGDVDQDIISWSPHGRCFIIHSTTRFASAVMPKYFKHTKLTSFQRQLNLYGFKRITRGRDRGAYYHELFLRGRPKLSTIIRREKVKGTGKKPIPDPEKEPKFYDMQFLCKKNSTPPLLSQSTPTPPPPPPKQDKEEQVNHDKRPSQVPETLLFEQHRQQVYLDPRTTNAQVESRNYLQQQPNRSQGQSSDKWNLEIEAAARSLGLLPSQERNGGHIPDAQYQDQPCHIQIQIMGTDKTMTAPTAEVVGSSQISDFCAAQAQDVQLSDIDSRSHSMSSMSFDQSRMEPSVDKTQTDDKSNRTGSSALGAAGSSVLSFFERASKTIFSHTHKSDETSIAESQEEEEEEDCFLSEGSAAWIDEDQRQALVETTIDFDTIFERAGNEFAGEYNGNACDMSL